MDKVKVKKCLCSIFAAVILAAPLCGAISAYADSDVDTEADTDSQGEAETQLEESSVAELDKLAYSGNDLGATYTPEGTTF